ncbi:NAD(+)/NADH kinase [Halovivax sp.]|uniref:NAD(+)/NADH kinase n=1 Tax=Halovivax sp. TaxID=1935978 RepID=UPI0025BB6DB5|nr:NAD(+)/NADH kinase [Halovivax sp.]
MDGEYAVGIVAKRGSDRAVSLADRLASELAADDVVTRVDEATARALGRPGRPVAELASCDLVVTVGGDGTFLFVVREVGDTPIVGVNLGEVGFLTAVDPDEATSIVPSLLERLREDSIDGRRIDRVVASGADWELVPALNEVVVQGPQRGPAADATVEIGVDGDRYLSTPADGAIVATPTGSTAYNLSEGGPLVRPGADALVVSPMAPTEGMPPLVVDADATVAVTLDGCESGVAIADGRTTVELEPPQTVTVERADDPAVVAGPRVDFFAALEKLR